MTWEPIIGKGGAWFRYGLHGSPQIGGNLPVLGQEPLTVFWGGTPKPEHLRDFFWSASNLLSKDKPPHLFETQIILREDEVHLSSHKSVLLPEELARQAHFVRFDCCVAQRESPWSPVGSRLAVWVSLDEPKDAVDSVGVFTTSTGIVLLSSLPQFVAETSHSSLTIDQARGMLEQLVKDVASINAPAC